MKILMISRKAKQCGVADYGKRLYDIIKNSFIILLFEVDSLDDYHTAVNEYQPDVILYNYHYATLPFIKDEVLDRSKRHVAIFHEAGLNFTPDQIIDTSIRPLFEGGPMTSVGANVPVIGSFGFGFPDKNFPGIAQVVREQFTEATIRLNIPFADYGDRDGQLALREVEKVRAVLAGTSIRLEVDHNYMTQPELLNFLCGNDINLFLYRQSHGRGLSSAIDYALSAYRPIGVSDSEMFRHLPRECVVGDLTQIMRNWFTVLQPVYHAHSNAKLIARYKALLA